MRRSTEEAEKERVSQIDEAYANVLPMITTYRHTLGVLRVLEAQEGEFGDLRAF